MSPMNINKKGNDYFGTDDVLEEIYATRTIHRLINRLVMLGVSGSWMMTHGSRLKPHGSGLMAKKAAWGPNPGPSQCPPSAMGPKHKPFATFSAMGRLR